MDSLWFDGLFLSLSLALSRSLSSPTRSANVRCRVCSLRVLTLHLVAVLTLPSFFFAGVLVTLVAVFFLSQRDVPESAVLVPGTAQVRSLIPLCFQIDSGLYILESGCLDRGCCPERFPLRGVLLFRMAACVFGGFAACPDDGPCSFVPRNGAGCFSIVSTSFRCVHWRAVPLVMNLCPRTCLLLVRRVCVWRHVRLWYPRL